MNALRGAAPRAAVKRFFRADAAGGIFLFAAALLALAMENFEAGAEWRGRFLHASPDLGAGVLGFLALRFIAYPDRARPRMEAAQ